MNEDEIVVTDGLQDTQDTSEVIQTGQETPSTQNDPVTPERTYRDGGQIEYDAAGRELPDHPDAWYDDNENFLAENPTYGMNADEIAAYEAAQQAEVAPIPTTPTARTQVPAAAPAASLNNPNIATPPAVQRPAYVPPPMPAQTLLPAMTEEEEGRLRDLAIQDPIQFSNQMRTRQLAEERAVQALRDYQEEVIGGQYQAFTSKHRFLIKQVLNDIPPQNLSNPAVPAYVIAQVNQRTALQMPTTREGQIEHLKAQIALLEGDDPVIATPAPVAQVPTIPEPVTPRAPALTRTQRATVPTAPVAGSRGNVSTSMRKNIPIRVRNLMLYEGLTEEEANRSLNEVK